MSYPPFGASDPRSTEALDNLSPALSELDSALLRDGAVWRRRLPNAGRAAHRAIARLHGAPSSPSTYQTSHAEPRAEVRPALSPLAAGHTRGLVAVATTVAVVGLLAALLHALNPVRGLTTTASRGTPTASPAVATATSAPNPWTTLPGYDDPATRKLVVAPSDPRVAYAILAGAPPGATVTPSKFAPPPTYELRRTDDGGASWRALNLPVPEPQNGQGSDYGIQSLAVSPADANTVFLAIQLGTAGLCDQYVGSGLGKSGSFCLAQYVSRDGGQQWQPLRLPAIAPQQPGQSALGARIATQGDRLYATIGDFCACSGAEPTGRIGVSTDGGLTWALADAGLVNQGRGADRFAASPSGSALFAVAEPVDATLTPVSATPPIPPAAWSSGAATMRGPRGRASAVSRITPRATSRSRPAAKSPTPSSISSQIPTPPEGRTPSSPPRSSAAVGTAARPGPPSQSLASRAAHPSSRASPRPWTTVPPSSTSPSRGAVRSMPGRPPPPPGGSSPRPSPPPRSRR